jgi:hypothetical protein
MYRAIACSLLAASIAAPATVAAATASEIFDTAREKQIERWEGVDSYVKTEDVMGQRVTTYYVRTLVETPDGGTETVFLPQPPGEQLVVDTGRDGPKKMTPEQMEAYADALDMTGDAMSDEIGNHLEEQGLPRNFLSALGGDPWMSPDPGRMMGGMSAFMRAGAQGQREMAVQQERDKMEAVTSMADFRDTAKLVGTEELDGRMAYHLRADDIDRVEPMDGGQEFVMQTMSLWLDMKEYVPLKTRMEGVIRKGKQERPAAIEQISADYRFVPDSRMYESYLQTMKLDGMMSDKQKAEMREAQKQLAEAEAQMAQMPADQRAMMERMMGGQLDAMRKMVAGGGFQLETTVIDIQVNPHLAAAAPQE